MAIGIAAEEKARQSLVVVPPATAENILPSAPVDVNTIGALLSATTFDYAAYRQAYPQEKGKIEKLRECAVTWDAPRNGTYWARVTAPPDASMPAQATAEEAANALFGTPTAVDQLVVVAPPTLRPRARHVAVARTPADAHRPRC